MTVKTNNFLLLWSLTSPFCLLLIGGILWLNGSIWYPFTGPTWHPFDANIWKSIIIYLIYWVLLGILQGSLLWQFQYKNLAHKWFIKTSVTGFLIMMCHEITPLILRVDTGGQGILYLILTLPVLAILGGLVLGITQFWLLLSYNSTTPALRDFKPAWIMASLASWIIGFTGIVFLNYTLFSMILFSTVGAAIKGYAVLKYLQTQPEMRA